MRQQKGVTTTTQQSRLTEAMILTFPMLHTEGEILPELCRLLSEVLPRLSHSSETTQYTQLQANPAPLGRERGGRLPAIETSADEGSHSYLLTP